MVLGVPCLTGHQFRRSGKRTNCYLWSFSISACFRFLTIVENLTMGPIWVRKISKKETEETAMYYLEKVQIAE